MCGQTRPVERSEHWGVWKDSETQTTMSFELGETRWNTHFSPNLPSPQSAKLQVVRQHRRSLVDRALGSLVPGPSSAAPTTAASNTAATAMPSPLVSVDGFRGVMTRFEKLSRSAPPKGVSELVYGDAYLVALSLSRRREVSFASRCCATCFPLSCLSVQLSRESCAHDHVPSLPCHPRIASFSYVSGDSRMHTSSATPNDIKVSMSWPILYPFVPCTLRARHFSASTTAFVVVLNKVVSHREATMEALLSSPALLWDVSGPRQEQQMPPTFSSRAMRSWLLSSWARYSDPVKVREIYYSFGVRSFIFS